MKTTRWLAIIGLVLVFSFAWELNRSDSLGIGLWVGYEALSIVAFTLAWFSLVCCAVIWVYRLAKRGYEEEGRDLVAAALTKVTLFNRN